MERVRVLADLGTNHNGDPALAERLAGLALECGCDGIVVPVGEPADGALPVAVAAALVPPAQLVLAPRSRAVIGAAAAAAPAALQLDAALLPDLDLVAAVGAAAVPAYLIAALCDETELLAALERLDAARTTVLHAVGARGHGVADAGFGTLTRLGVLAPHSTLGYYGYASHPACLAIACAFGARVLEAPFTSDPFLPGPAHGSSFDPRQLAEAVRLARAVDQARAVPARRELLPIELDEAAEQRVGLVAAVSLRRGTVLTPELVSARAPARGLSPRLLPQVLGKAVLFDLEANAPITFGVVAS